MSYNLFLDDEKIPQTAYYKDYDEDYQSLKWEIVRGYNSFVKIIKERGAPTVVSFDYDLNDFEHDGLDCARFLRKYCEENNLTLPVFKVHSNWPGAYGKFNNIFNT